MTTARIRDICAAIFLLLEEQINILKEQARLPGMDVEVLKRHARIIDELSRLANELNQLSSDLDVRPHDG